MARAFKLRSAGTTIKEVRDYLRKHGIDRTYHGVQHLLQSRIVVGEIHFGELVNLAAHPPIVDADTFRRVQAMSGRRGRRPSSDRLLARLGVLRCAECGSRMVVGVQTSRGRRYPFYRCPPTGDCARRCTIGAEIVEDAIVEKVRAALANVEGRAAAEANARDAERGLAVANDALRAAVETFTGFEDVPETRERLQALRQLRDVAQARVDQLGDVGTAVSLNASADWERLTLDERRALIRAIVERATVAPGRGADRVSVELFVV